MYLDDRWWMRLDEYYSKLEKQEYDTFHSRLIPCVSHAL
jgi:hypothetical protein